MGQAPQEKLAQIRHRQVDQEGGHEAEEPVAQPVQAVRPMIRQAVDQGHQEQEPQKEPQETPHQGRVARQGWAEAHGAPPQVGQGAAEDEEQNAEKEHGAQDHGSMAARPRVGCNGTACS